MEPNQENRNTSQRGGAHLKPKTKNNGAARAAQVGIVAASAVGVAALTLVAYTFLYPNIHLGLRAGDAKIGGMHVTQAAQEITQQCQNQMYAQALTIDVNGQSFTISPRDVTDGLDSTTTAQQAYDYTHTGNFFTRMGHTLSALFTHHDIDLAVNVNTENLDAQLAEISAQTLTEPVDPTWRIEDSSLIIDAGKAGVDFDTSVVAQALTQQLESLDFEPYTVEAKVVAQQPISLEQIKAEADTEAKNATVDKTDGKTILPSQDGVEVDIAVAQQMLSAQPDAQTYTIPITRTPAKVTAATLSSVLFRDTLGTATTNFGSSSASRANNVQLASSFINGLILNPGEEFSYNNVVGERTSARGFKSAGAYSAGKLVDEVGGGVCQPSSTLYMAVLRADLKVTERTNHGFTVSYTPLGEDATVSYGSLDFKFRNSTDYPVKIIADSSGRKLTMRIVGTNATGKSVTTEREIIATYSPETIEKTDASLPAGTKTVDQTATTGYKVDVYKIVTENGQTTRTKANTSTYKKRDKIVLVGAGAASTTTAAAEAATQQTTAAATQATETTTQQTTAAVTQDGVADPE